MAQRIINIGSSANKGDGDPIRTAFSKVNDNFTELYGKVTVLEDGTVAQVQDTKGSIFADDSTLLVDAINGIIPASVVSGTLNNNTVGTHTGPVDGDLVGSVFADNSTLLVDGVNGTIPYSVLSGTPTIPTATSELTNDSGFLTSAPAPTVISDKIIASQQELTTSFSYTATALTITVTPSSVTAPVFVTFNFNAVSKDTESDSNLNLQLYQDGVAVTDSELTQILMDDQSTTYATFPISYSYAFIPGTTSATVLTLYAKNGGGYRCMIGSSIGNTFQANAIVW